MKLATGVSFEIRAYDQSDSKLKLLFSSSQIMEGGTANFKEIAFVGDPGSQTNKFFIRTGLINP